jgi:hypothetical protein
VPRPAAETDRSPIRDLLIRIVDFEREHRSFSVVLTVGLNAFVFLPWIYRYSKWIWLPDGVRPLLAVPVLVGPIYFMVHYGSARESWTRAKVKMRALLWFGLAMGFVVFHLWLNSLFLVPVDDGGGTARAVVHAAGGESTPERRIPTKAVRPYKLPSSVTDRVELEARFRPSYSVYTLIAEDPEWYWDKIRMEAPGQLFFITVLFVIGFVGAILCISAAIALAQELPEDSLVACGITFVLELLGEKERTLPRTGKS